MPAQQKSSESIPRRAVQYAAFVELCHRRGLLPDGPAEGLVSLTRDRLDPVLDDPETDPADVARAWGALGPVADEPEALGRLHLRELGRERASRKARGVFYTPECVARYMVEGAMCPLDGSTEGDSPIFAETKMGTVPGAKMGTVPGRDAAHQDLAILDPACGCGAFLLAAYRRLLAGEPRAGLARRIELARRLHGIDLDADAVLAARRTLWLEMVGSGPMPPLGATGFLAENIRQGDALADPPPEPGAFDLVLSNPPYRRERGAKELLDRVAQTPWGRQWRAARMDLWHFFLHRGLDLLSDGGRLAFVVNAYWTAGRGAAALIERLRREARVEELFDLGNVPVFPGVAGRHLILRLVKTSNHQPPTTIKRIPSAASRSVASYLDGSAPLVVFSKHCESLFLDGRIDLEPPRDELLAKLARDVPLGRLGIVRQGIAENPAAINARTNRRFGDRWTVGQGVFSLTPEELDALALPPREQTLVRPYFDARDLVRDGRAACPSRRLIYSTARTCPDIDAFPTIRAHLARFRPVMDARRETLAGARPWWQLHWPRDEGVWLAPKILSVQMARRPTFVPAVAPAYVPFSVNVFVPAVERPEHLFYFAAVLRSRLLAAWFSHHAKRRGVGLEINGRVLAAAPIRPIDPTDAADLARHDELVDLVRQDLAVSPPSPPGSAFPASATGSASAAVPSATGSASALAHQNVRTGKASGTQRRIDEIVESLYGLSAAEMAALDADGPAACHGAR
ncbi:MAG: N-6 DNA methylase [Pirellulales bacterium]|nr:N-6 DNA methylase [Pirellulales bacterium]